MNPATLLASLVATLRPALDSRQCKLSVASDVEHVMEILTNSPSTQRAILLWQGHAEEGEVPGGGCVDGEFEIILQANPGLAVDPGQWIYTPSNARESMLATSAWLTGFIRSLRWTVADPDPPPPAGTLAGHPQVDPLGPRSTGSRWLLIDGLPTVQLQHTFLLGFALDAVESLVPVPV